MTLPTRKLVRDKDPERVLILENKRMNVVSVTDEKEFRQLLAEKLSEEAGEFQQNPSAEELADIATALHFIYAAYQFEPGRVRALQRGRCRKAGSELHIELVGKGYAFFRDRTIEHLADFHEVFENICASSLDFAFVHVKAVRRHKREERGEFKRRLVWDFTHLS